MFLHFILIFIWDAGRFACVQQLALAQPLALTMNFAAPQQALCETTRRKGKQTIASWLTLFTMLLLRFYRQPLWRYVCCIFLFVFGVVLRTTLHCGVWRHCSALHTYSCLRYCIIGVLYGSTKDYWNNWPAIVWHIHSFCIDLLHKLTHMCLISFCSQTRRKNMLQY